MAGEAQRQGAGDGLRKGEAPEGAVGVGLGEAALGAEGVEVDGVAGAGGDRNRGDGFNRLELGETSLAKPRHQLMLQPDAQTLPTLSSKLGRAGVSRHLGREGPKA